VRRRGSVLICDLLLTSAARLLPPRRIKPDGVQRGLVAEIISRFEKRGYQLKGTSLRVVL
jgi:hypothetical protein